jgi:octaprenyl-diphosphate synthase
LGTAFQLVDDLLDYDGNTHDLGKNVGDDLREGKPTLPLLLAMERCEGVERQLIRDAIVQGQTTQIERILKLVRSCGAIQSARDMAQVEAQAAARQLASWPSTTYRDALLDFCVQSAGRSS